jgi:hypothetical protein
MAQCRHCFEVLTDACWAPSHKAKQWHICKACAKKQIDIIKQKNPVAYCITGMLQGAKRRAKHYNISYDLTRQYLINIFPSICPISKRPFSFQQGHIVDDSPSLDRIEPFRGYVIGNVHIISHKYNRMKSNWPLPELRKLVNYMETKV